MAVAPTSQNDPRAQAGQQRASSDSKKAGQQGSAAWFAQQILERIGAPTSGSNIQAMVSWMAAEGGHWNNSATYNPLNTTLAMKGDNGTMNSVGVRKYSSWEQGIEATAETLLGGKGRYSNIIDAFKSGQAPNKIYAAVTSSPWGTHKIGTVSTAYGVSAAHGGTVGNTSAAGAAGYSPDDLASTFGFSSAFFGTDPSLKALLNRAISEQWYASDSGLALFKSALKGTTWYQTHSASAREWIQLQTSDPTEMKHQISQKTADLRAEATQLGLNIPSARLGTIATNILKYGLDSTQEQEALAAEMKYQKKWDGNGMAGQLQDQLMKAAGDYGYTMDNSSAFKAVQSILLNQKNSDFYLDQMRQAAKIKHPGMSKLIDQGMSVRDIAQPYLQSMQNVLEIDPANIDLSKDATLQKAFSYKDPNAKNTKGDVDPSLMPTWQFEQTLRQDPRWMQTDNAQKSFMDTGVSVLRNMGLVT